jgi:hypothetical protein
VGAGVGATMLFGKGRVGAASASVIAVGKEGGPDGFGGANNAVVSAASAGTPVGFAIGNADVSGKTTELLANGFVDASLSGFAPSSPSWLIARAASRCNSSAAASGCPGAGKSDPGAPGATCVIGAVGGAIGFSIGTGGGIAPAEIVSCGAGGVVGREPPSRADWFNGGWTFCGIGTVGATRDIGMLGRDVAPGYGGATGGVAEGTAASCVGIGAVAAICARVGEGEVGRIGCGKRPEGEIRRELEFGAGGGTGEFARTDVGTAGGRGGSVGITPGTLGVGRTPVGGRGGGTKSFTSEGPGAMSRGTNSSVAGTWLSSMIFGCDDGAGDGIIGAAAAGTFAALACSRKISSVNGSAMLVTEASTAFWSGRRASKSGGMRITTSISGSVTGMAR